MKLNIEILDELRQIFNDHERAAELEGVFGNYKPGRSILLVDAQKGETIRTGG